MSRRSLTIKRNVPESQSIDNIGVVESGTGASRKSQQVLSSIKFTNFKFIIKCSLRVRNL